jgi:hypothetical protein
MCAKAGVRFLNEKGARVDAFSETKVVSLRAA